MGMSMFVTGFWPPDEKWQQMKAAWDACAAAGVPVPEEVEDFFGGEAPDPAGVEVDLPVRHSTDGSSELWEVDVAAIPEAVTVIRFSNTW